MSKQQSSERNETKNHGAVKGQVVTLAPELARLKPGEYTVIRRREDISGKG